MSAGAAPVLGRAPRLGAGHLSLDAIVAYVDDELARRPHARAQAASRRLPRVRAPRSSPRARPAPRCGRRGCPRLPSSLLSALRSIPHDTELPDAARRARDHRGRPARRLLRAPATRSAAHRAPIRHARRARLRAGAVVPASARRPHDRRAARIAAGRAPRWAHWPSALAAPGGRRARGPERALGGVVWSVPSPGSTPPSSGRPARRHGGAASAGYARPRPCRRAPGAARRAGDPLSSTRSPAGMS